jgi:hypothetical protein
MKKGGPFLVAVLISMVCVGMSYAEGENIPTSRAYVDSNIATKQGILSHQQSDNVAVTFPTTAGGTPGTRTINTSLGSSTSDTSLATTGAINTALSHKQAKINGTANTVITYTGSEGGTGSKAVYNSTNAYSGQTGSLAEAQHVNGAVVKGFNAHLTCADPDDGCLLWDVNTLSTSNVYVPEPVTPTP